jgi:FAD/FMN-containing dehydrogenase
MTHITATDQRQPLAPATDQRQPLAPATDLGPLRSTFAGEILTPADGDQYGEARVVFNAMFDGRPAAIARATCDGDVIAAVLFVQSARLPLAARAGGHSVAGYSTIDDGLLLDLRPMRKIEVDTVARTARVGPGVTWGELDAATQEHGLATTGGRMTTTGVAGFVLGSGSGWLERVHGLACDNLVSARVVTADGRVVTASETENPDLFWRLHGGGGNFGVVTEFELRLHRVGPTVYGGMLIYPRDREGQVCRNVRDVLARAPREVVGGVILMTAPPAPFVPAELPGERDHPGAERRRGRRGLRGRHANRRAVGALVLSLRRDLDRRARHATHLLGQGHGRGASALDDGRDGAELLHRCRRRPGAERLRRGEVLPPGRAQGPLRPRQRIPPKPERAAIDGRHLTGQAALVRLTT